MKLKQAFLKENNKTIIVYYSLGGKEMKLPTGVSLIKRGEIIQSMRFNKKTSKLEAIIKNEATYADITAKQNTIDAVLARVNQIILEYFTKGIQIQPEELKNIFLSGQETKTEAINKTLYDWYNDFLEHKRLHFQTNGSEISIKDYNSTYNLLLDYEKHTNTPLRVQFINQIWLQKLQIFAGQAHDTSEYLTEGVMKSSTFKKRLSILAEFLNYVKGHNTDLIDQSVIDAVVKFNKGIKRQIKAKETLTVEEVHQLHQYQPTKPHLVKIKDLFVFLCHTGIRFQDYTDFDARFIKDIDGKPVYIKKASKTGINYNVPLSNVAIEILQKYDNKLPSITNQQANRDLKDLLEETGWYDDITENQDKFTKEYLTRYESLTMHKARNTFITNLVDHVPLNELMKYTGHRKLSTLQSYIDTRRPVQPQYINIFNK